MWKRSRPQSRDLEPAGAGAHGEDSRSPGATSTLGRGEHRLEPQQIRVADPVSRHERKARQLTDWQEQSQLQQQKKKTKKQPAIVAFFKRIKLRPLWRRRNRSRSRGRLRRTPKDSADGDDCDEDVEDAIAGRPGSLELRPLPPSARSLLSAVALASLPLDPWSCPYDFAVQGDRLLVPGLEVAEFSLVAAASGVRRAWPCSLGRYVPLCIDVTPSLVYLTAASLTGCGLFVFDRAGRLARSRVLPFDADGASDEEARTIRGRRPRMFAVRVNFRGECWVTNPCQVSVDHYTPALRRIRRIDTAKFGVPYYLTAHSHRFACLWVSFPEAGRVVKFDWLTLQPLCHLAFGPGQSPCGLHLDEWGEQLFVTDIGSGRVLVYHAASMGLAAASTRAANAAVAGFSERPAAVRLAGGRLLLLSCSDRCRIDVYSVAFDNSGDRSED